MLPKKTFYYYSELRTQIFTGGPLLVTNNKKKLQETFELREVAKIRLLFATPPPPHCMGPSCNLSVATIRALPPYPPS